MIKAFRIYKEGTTSEWITILIPENIFTDELLRFKIEKYIFLGYQIELI